MTTIEVLQQLLVEALELATYQQVMQKDTIIAGRAEIERLEKCEPVAWLIPGTVTRDPELAKGNGNAAKPLYTAPAIPESWQKDAERYRWLRVQGTGFLEWWADRTPEEGDAAIDAAMGEK